MASKIQMDIMVAQEEQGAEEALNGLTIHLMLGEQETLLLFQPLLEDLKEVLAELATHKAHQTNMEKAVAAQVAHAERMANPDQGMAEMAAQEHQLLFQDHQFNRLAGAEAENTAQAHHQDLEELGAAEVAANKLELNLELMN